MATFTITRSAFIPAPAEEIYPHVIGFRGWLNWSPWEAIDPSMRRSYSGPVEGVGAKYAWAGNGKAGAGTRVTWLMTGENKGIARVFSLFVNMDKLAGTDFEKGLAQLAAVVAAGR